MLVRVLYASRIGEGVSSADIQRLVASAQRRNRQLDLTGALLVCDGHFVQALEGQAMALDGVMEKIAMDSRHHGVLVQARSPIGKRIFATWDMAFVDDSRCMPKVDELLAGTLAPEPFMHLLVDWIEERKEAPYRPG